MSEKIAKLFDCSIEKILIWLQHNDKTKNQRLLRVSSKSKLVRILLSIFEKKLKFEDIIGRPIA